MKKSALAGGVYGILIWLIITIADAIDEIIINTDLLLGALVFFALPITALIIYIRHYIKTKPAPKNLVSWFTGFYITSMPLWYIIFSLINNRNFIVHQKDRSHFMSLNGIEYMLYGFPAIIGFTILCIIFHIIYAIIKKINHVNKQTT